MTMSNVVTNVSAGHMMRISDKVDTLRILLLPAGKYECARTMHGTCTENRNSVVYLPSTQTSIGLPVDLRRTFIEWSRHNKQLQLQTQVCKSLVWSIRSRNMQLTGSRHVISITSLADNCLMCVRTCDHQVREFIHTRMVIRRCVVRWAHSTKLLRRRTARTD